MKSTETFELLARYNRWMNEKVFAAAASLDAARVAEDQGAFFGSILGTLNHLMVGDLIWLQRFARHPSGYRALAALDGVARPGSLDAILHRDLAELRARREWLDGVILAWAGELGEPDLDVMLEYQDTRGNPHRNHFGRLILHLFNHQTHHRGQATTLLSRSGVDVGATDLLALIRS